jgi:hypothetical protein
MKARELAAILRELEKHPRIASIAVGDLRVTYRDATQPEAGAFAEPETEPETLDLPGDVFDPRKAIEKVYAKHRRPSAREDGAS